MKVLIISAALPPLKTGGADFVRRLCTELATSGVKVDVIGPAAASFDESAVTIHRIEGKWDWRAAQRCINICREVQPDVVDVIFTGWMYHDHPMVTFLPTMIKKTCENVRVVVHIESLDGIRRSKSNVVRASGRYIASLIVGRRDLSYEYGSLLRDSDAIITLSERDRNELIGRDASVSKKSVTIPPPPIMPVVPALSEPERTKSRARLGITADDAVLGFYGYLYPGKGLEILFEAIQSLRNRGRKLKLIIVGDEPESYVLNRESRSNYSADLKKLAQKLNIHEHVVWSEYAPYGSTEPSRKLRLCDICVFPFVSGVNLHNSSFWFAAAHGLPIITTKGKTTEDVFANRQNVLLAQPNDVEDLAQQISALCINPHLRKTIGDNVASLTNEQFSWAQCVKKTIEIFEHGPARS